MGGILLKLLTSGELSYQSSSNQINIQSDATKEVKGRRGETIPASMTVNET